MTLKDYFEGRPGICILSSADRGGKVTTAVYSAPRVMEDNTVCFIMRERLTYRNILENPHAACMYIEHGAGYQGIRLFLTKVREDNDQELISRMTRRHLSPEEDRAKGPKHLVIFRVDKVLPLIGDSETGITVA
jgi:hypothetical protein